MLDAALAALPATELALREGGRSVVLCESANEGELMRRVEVLQQVEGVIGVSLVHHHAEAHETLLQELTT